MSTTDTTPTPVSTTVTGLTSREAAALRTSLALMRRDGLVELTGRTAIFHERSAEQVVTLLQKRTKQFGISDQQRAGLQGVIDRLTPLDENVFEPPTEEKPMDEQINEMAESLPELIEQLTATMQAAQLTSVHELLNISLATLDAAIQITTGLRDNNPDDKWVAGLFTRLEQLSKLLGELEEAVKEGIVSEQNTDSE